MFFKSAKDYLWVCGYHTKSVSARFAALKQCRIAQKTKKVWRFCYIFVKISEKKQLWACKNQEHSL